MRAVGGCRGGAVSDSTAAPMSRRRSHWGTVLAAGVLIVAGFGVAVVEALRLPKGSIWLVVATALLLLFAIRRVTR